MTRNVASASETAGSVPQALIDEPFVKPEPWVKDALCAQTSPELFFPDADAPENATALARRVCAACPVADACLTYALAHNEREGIWGGLTPAQRAKIKPFPRKPRSTLCARGHDLTPSNTYTSRNGRVTCKACEQELKHSA